MGFLCLHIRRFLCYTAKNSKIVSYSFAVATYPREGTETTTALGGLSDDIGDLQYERLSQAQDFYTSRGWCPGAKKEMLCKMHASYRAKGRNHLSEHYEEEILRLADKPEKEEDA